jgi:DNA-binding SARP family transcriptional activator
VSVADGPVAFGLLGPLLVTNAHGMAIPIPQAKQRVIVAALLLRANATVSVDQLTDALWEDQPPPNAPAVIRTYVARVRHALGQAGTRLVSRPAGYAIEVRGPAELDLDELERLRAESRNASEAGHWGQVAAATGAALGLWRGAALEDIPSAVLHRLAVERLDELRLQFAAIRVDAELHLGREHHVITEIQQLAREHPLREHIQAQLMLAYYRCGRQAEALAVYRKVRTSLVDELGIEPGLELCELHQRILTADRAPRAGRLPRARVMRPRCPGDAGLTKNGAQHASVEWRGSIMRTGVRKALTGKTMRVATTFTGVAACAAAFAPAATAATGQPALTHDQEGQNPAAIRAQNAAGVRGDTALRAGAVKPAISERYGCPGGTSNWFHLAYDKVSDTCFGFTGTEDPGYYATSFCGGNNTGWISGYYDGIASLYYYTPFGHGTTYAHITGTSADFPLYVTGVHISGWSGNDGCKFP